MDQVAIYKLSAEVISRDQLNQLFVDFEQEFSRYEGARYIFPLPDGTINRLLTFPGVDGLTEILIQPLDKPIYITLGNPAYNQRRKINVAGVFSILNADPIDPTNAVYLTYIPGDMSVANVLVYFSGLRGVIPVPPPAPPPTGFEVGSFSISTTGFAVNPTGTADFIQGGPLVVLTIPNLTGTSNATIFTITGLPTDILPTVDETFIARVSDDGEEVVGIIKLTAGSSTIEVFSGFTGGEENPFVASGTKGLKSLTITYQQI